MLNTGNNSLNSATLDHAIEENEILANKLFIKNGRWGDASSYAFIISSLNIFYNKEFTEKELENIIIDGANDESIDVIYFTPEGTIDIFDFKNSKRASQGDIKAFFDSIMLNILKRPISYEQFNSRLVQALKKIQRARNKKFRMYVVRRGKNAPGAEFFLEKQSEFEKGFASVDKVKFLDENTLIQENFYSESYPLKWSVRLDRNEKLYHYKAGKEFIFTISIKKMVKLMHECETNNLDLFSKNVRKSLHEKSLSLGLLETIRKEPKNFYRFHNGITIAAKRITKKTVEEYDIYSPQVLNGAQTLNAIFDKYKNNLLSANLAKAHILCKIFILDNSLTEKICETSNTQAKIELSDLRSNDSAQVQLELFINSIPDANYIYLRKRPFRRFKGMETITLPELMQWSYSALFRKPSDAKNSKKLLFDASNSGLYKRVVARIKNPDALKRLCEVGIFTRKRIFKEKKKSKKEKEIKSLLRSADFHIIACLYLMNGNPTAIKYNKIKKTIVNFVKAERIGDPSLSNNAIFTKSTKLWDHLEAELNL